MNNHSAVSQKSEDNTLPTLFNWDYAPSKIHRGYAGGILHIDLCEKKAKAVPLSQEERKFFVGGRGFCIKQLWERLKPGMEWSDPANPLVISPGPISGVTQYPGAGKSIVMTLSPLTGIPIDSNSGGHFGPLLKCAGWDALEVVGKSEKKIILLIDGDAGRVSFVEDFIQSEDSHVICEGLTDFYGRDDAGKRHIGVICTGRASKTSRWGMLNFSLYDPNRKVTRMKQAARGGIGMVFMDKGIKAIVVKSSHPLGNMNDPMSPEIVSKLGMKVHKEIFKFDRKQLNMRRTGTPSLVAFCNKHDLLPVNNWRYGQHPEHSKITGTVWEKRFTQGIADGCWYGCSIQCAKSVASYELKTGPYKGKRVLVDGPEYETVGGVGSNDGIFDADFILESNFYCDVYGLDSISIGTGIAFVMECYERGILDREKTGGLELFFGNRDAAMELVHQIADGKGFGLIAGRGIRYMKGYFAEHYGADASVLADIGMEVKGLEFSQYGTKECLSQQAGYAIANKGPQHDETWMMGMEMSHFIPTIKRKAEEIRWFSLFRTWMGLVGLCKMPWADIAPEDNHLKPHPFRFQEHVDNYVALFEAVTGEAFSEEELLKQSERIHNLQRLLNIRMGVYGSDTDRPPYRAMGPVTDEEYLSRESHYDKQLSEERGLNPKKMSLPAKVAALRGCREELYAQLQQAVYEERGWNSEGIPTPETLARLGITSADAMNLIKNTGKEGERQ